ncbi:MAG: hypothetical protein KGH69_04345 [Candidatus Micrarchaeota archaeon]|nr:hypothetical protein [Candidatus Micrarchaeota archaeon]
MSTLERQRSPVREKVSGIANSDFAKAFVQSHRIPVLGAGGYDRRNARLIQEALELYYTGHTLSWYATFSHDTKEKLELLNDARNCYRDAKELVESMTVSLKASSDMKQEMELEYEYATGLIAATEKDETRMSKNMAVLNTGKRKEDLGKSDIEASDAIGVVFRRATIFYENAAVSFALAAAGAGSIITTYFYDISTLHDVLQGLAAACFVGTTRYGSKAMSMRKKYKNAIAARKKITNDSEPTSIVLLRAAVHNLFDGRRLIGSIKGEAAKALAHVERSSMDHAEATFEKDKVEREKKYRKAIERLDDAVAHMDAILENGHENGTDPEIVAARKAHVGRIKHHIMDKRKHAEGKAEEVAVGIMYDAGKHYRCDPSDYVSIVKGAKLAFYRKANVMMNYLAIGGAGVGASELVTDRPLHWMAIVVASVSFGGALDYGRETMSKFGAYKDLSRVKRELDNNHGNDPTTAK